MVAAVATASIGGEGVHGNGGFKRDSASSVRFPLHARASSSTSARDVVESYLVAVTNKYPSGSLSPSGPSGPPAEWFRRRASIAKSVVASSGGALYANITIGTPPQNFFVDCDTGSDALNRFTASTSSTFTYANGASNVQTITYGTGSVEGVPSNDTVTWGGYTSVAQPFLLVTAEDQVMAEQMLDTGDGIMGLAYSEGLSRATSDTILSGLAAHAQLPADFFSLWFNQSATSLSSVSTPYGGLLILGEIDSALYTGDFSYASLVPSVIPTSDGSATSIIYYWSVNAGTISVSGGGSISPPSGTIVIVDSGTTLIVLDDTTFTSLISSLDSFVQLQYSSSSQVYYTTCTAAEKLPAINFMLGGNGVSYTLTPSQYIFSDGQECVLGIQSSGSTSAEWVFGQVFLANYYSVFDFTNKRVGFAVTAGSSVLASTDANVITDAGSAGSGAATTSGSKSSFAERSVSLTKENGVRSLVFRHGDAFAIDVTPRRAAKPVWETVVDARTGLMLVHRLVTKAGLSLITDSYDISFEPNVNAYNLVSRKSTPASPQLLSSTTPKSQPDKILSHTARTQFPAIQSPFLIDSSRNTISSKNAPPSLQPQLKNICNDCDGGCSGSSGSMVTRLVTEFEIADAQTRQTTPWERQLHRQHQQHQQKFEIDFARPQTRIGYLHSSVAVTAATGANGLKRLRCRAKTAAADFAGVGSDNEVVKSIAGTRNRTQTNNNNNETKNDIKTTGSLQNEKNVSNSDFRFPLILTHETPPPQQLSLQKQQQQQLAEKQPTVTPQQILLSKPVDPRPRQPHRQLQVNPSSGTIIINRNGSPTPQLKSPARKCSTTTTMTIPLTPRQRRLSQNSVPATRELGDDDYCCASDDLFEQQWRAAAEGDALPVWLLNDNDGNEAFRKSVGDSSGCGDDALRDRIEQMCNEEVAEFEERLISHDALRPGSRVRGLLIEDCLVREVAEDNND
ncbi:hypothetical protein HK100_012500 [Physocladia obscura]|uniref:Peptidase A1 domain-containing protein n=1 Tax=Physocladia obscura TaxID=109957 RepID=A0AAD5T148_9FUNG|nr:hypothetical protein HK100_012500 [Physocladia obscura]